ncbi:MAG: sugar ABC transporter ATP-binding protein [Bauldia sp.]|nr:sugar ABC transporter ATP-binding protein [Bauldia sp.]
MSSIDKGVVPLVEARGLSRRYGTTLALDNVTMTVAAGRSVALVGRNGAGKSTMVRLLTGLDRPDSGTVFFAGEPAPDISARSAWRSRVACVYQKSTIIPDLSVGENLFLNDEPGAGMGTINWRETRRRTRDELARWALDVEADEPAGALTVGQKQLLEIARALRQGSRFIILDEPTARLESREISQLFEHVTRLKKEGVTFLFISHHLQEIYEICEEVVVMRDGRLIVDAPVSELGHDALVAAMVGEEGAALEPGKAGAAASRASRADDGAPPIVLDVEGLSVDGVVDGASMQIRAGERVGLAGLGGSGKTEFAEAIVGELVPSAGRISVSGRVLRPGRVDVARDTGVGYVPEDRHANGFCANLSVEENMALPVLHRISRMGFISRARRRQLAMSLIERLQIKVSGPTQNTSELSGGNQQKTVMGRALASDPDVLVLGYPTAGVDIASKQALFAVIEAAESAVLLVSDEIDELAICDRVLVMFGGRIVREFTGEWEEREMVAAIEGLGQ